MQLELLGGSRIKPQSDIKGNDFELGVLYGEAIAANNLLSINKDEFVNTHNGLIELEKTKFENKLYGESVTESDVAYILYGESFKSKLDSGIKKIWSFLVSLYEKIEKYVLAGYDKLKSVFSKKEKPKEIDPSKKDEKVEVQTTEKDVEEISKIIKATIKVAKATVDSQLESIEKEINMLEKATTGTVAEVKPEDFAVFMKDKKRLRTLQKSRDALSKKEDVMEAEIVEEIKEPKGTNFDKVVEDLGKGTKKETVTYHTASLMEKRLDEASDDFEKRIEELSKKEKSSYRKLTQRLKDLRSKIEKKLNSNEMTPELAKIMTELSEESSVMLQQAGTNRMSMMKKFLKSGATITKMQRDLTKATTKAAKAK